MKCKKYVAKQCWQKYKYMCGQSFHLCARLMTWHLQSKLRLQVRCIACDWLPWLLRMSRPGRRSSPREHQLRRSRLRALAAKTPASLSLISNVLDVESNVSSLQQQPHPICSSAQAAESLRRSTVVRDLHCELSAILAELRFLTQRIRQEAAFAEEASDWKYAAMVLDRLCLCVCSFYFVVGTLAIFLSVANMTMLRW